MKVRQICSLAFGLAVVALAGCTAPTVKSDFSFKDDQSDGLVFFSLSHDLIGTTSTRVMFYIDGGPVNGGSMVYTLEQNPLTLTGYPGEFEESHGRLIALVLPAGKHGITSWQVTGVGNVRLGPSGALPPLEFNVEARQVKYLGAINENLRMGKNIIGVAVLADAVPEVQDKRGRDVELFGKKYPQFKDKVTIDLLALGSWTAGSGTSRTVNTPPPSPPPPRLQTK